MAGNRHGMEEPGYVSYLLRLWRVESEGRTIWRSSLECPHSGEVQGFADLGALCRGLRARTEGEGGAVPRQRGRLDDGPDRASSVQPGPNRIRG
jgi:hypothetical protein